MSANKKHLTNAQRRRQLNNLKKNDNHGVFSKGYTEQISLCRMPRPKGKIYKDLKYAILFRKRTNKILKDYFLELR